MEISDRAKVKVLSAYPKARVEKECSMYFISIGKGYGRKDLGAGFSEEGAWCSAGYYL